MQFSLFNLEFELSNLSMLMFFFLIFNTIIIYIYINDKAKKNLRSQIGMDFIATVTNMFFFGILGSGFKK